MTNKTIPARKDCPATEKRQLSDIYATREDWQAARDSIPGQLDDIQSFRGRLKVPQQLLIYILFCLIASRKPRGRATLIVFLLWILTIVATGGLILREYGGEQRHRLHELFDEARDELRDRESDRMQEWEAADTVSVIATEPAPQTAPASDSAHRITIKGPKKQKVDIRVTEHSVNIDFDDESYE